MRPSFYICLSFVLLASSAPTTLRGMRVGRVPPELQAFGLASSAAVRETGTEEPGSVHVGSPPDCLKTSTCIGTSETRDYSGGSGTGTGTGGGLGLA